MRIAFALALLVMAVAPAGAVEPDEVLADPVLEARARDISKNLRCLVCQNQSIDDSDAGLARDLRVIVRERLVAGDSDSAVIDFVVDRYGDFVLLNPPFKATTYVLWIGPGVIGIFGLLAVFVFFRRRRATVSDEAPVPLSDEEKKRLEALTKDRSR
ncbi:MAG: cytochrome c-type biogenesis protein CcmH [Rhodospirillales bacterium]|jgi:cytochrome c-type biogenesis protein CcmH|nr:cytochrome c-type biogenesis protein CcmH [Rhodospirillales bacterium]